MATATRAIKYLSLVEVVGTPVDLPLADLPTNRSVLRLALKIISLGTLSAGAPLAWEAAQAVAGMAKGAWLRVNHCMESSKIMEWPGEFCGFDSSLKTLSTLAK